MWAADESQKALSTKKLNFLILSKFGSSSIPTQSGVQKKNRTS